ncbi:MAG: very short patch repair endonuclease [Candidatus Sulfotelmatobacter sp.]
MSAIRAKDTRPELAVRGLLHQLGYRYRLHARNLPGRPDIVFRNRHSVIFVHGCFWHGHNRCKLNRAPQSRRDYWIPKLEANQRRDQEVVKRLNAAGWRSLVVWECEIANVKTLARTLRAFLGPQNLKA